MDFKTCIQNNPTVLLERKKLDGVLRDIFVDKNDLFKSKVLLFAFDEGVLQWIEKNSPLDNMQKNQFAQNLSVKYGITKSNGLWATQEWLSVVTPRLLQQLKDAKQKAKNEQTAQKQAQKVLPKATRDEQVFVSRDERGGYYINPTLTEQEDRVFVPCGFDKADFGFFINGITKTTRCTNEHANLFALVYNFLTRNSQMTCDDAPDFLKDKQSLYDLDFKSIYRLAVILLQMVRHNYAKGHTLDLNYCGKDDVLQYALEWINHYAGLFCRLMHIDKVSLRVNLCKTGHTVSCFEQKGIFATDNKTLVTNAREIWFGRKINYKLGADDLNDMQYLLKTISPFGHFKEGQYQTLCNMLADKKHSVCIMPTGSGKSLVFYLISLLQPLPLFVISPTDILIKDQIRNLKQTHRIDNVAHLLLTNENSFENFCIRNSINYLTPMTLQSRNMLVKLRYINAGSTTVGMMEKRIADGPLLSYVVLDEIHCISNWGHDFRPEYQMLSKFLNKFLDNVTFLGFTATANYTIAQDVQNQLGINQNNVFSPVSFEKYTVSYDYRCMDSMQDMYDEVKKIALQLVAKKQKTIIFTKNDEVSQKVADAVGYEAEVFCQQNTDAYLRFAKGKCFVLVASSDLGVGINLPDVRNTIHFGMPLSKSEYVQEIGRAGRANEKSVSYIIYLKDTPSNVSPELLDRSTNTNRIPALLKNRDNDFDDVYKKLTNNCPDKQVLFDKLFAFSQGLKKLSINSFAGRQVDEAKQLLHMLYITGYVKDWYAYRKNNADDGVDILADVDSSYGPGEATVFERMRQRLGDYFEDMGNEREYLSKTSRATTQKQLMAIFVEWYYNRYLYHHREQFLDFFDFVQANKNQKDANVTDQIKDYFTLPFAKVRDDEDYFLQMSFEQIADKGAVGISKQTHANIERINSNRYSHKLDFLLFCSNCTRNNLFEKGRLERILQKATKHEKTIVAQTLQKLYGQTDLSSKLKMLGFIKQNDFRLGTRFDSFFDQLYQNNVKDAVYYGVVAQKANKVFAQNRR